MDVKTSNQLLAIASGALAIGGLLLLVISILGETRDNWALSCACAAIFLSNLFNLIRLQRKHNEGQKSNSGKNLKRNIMSKRRAIAIFFCVFAVLLVIGLGFLLQKVTEEPVKTVAYATDRVKVRQQPNMDCDILGLMETGDEVTVLGTEGDWSHVIAGGKEGYIKSEFLTSKQPSGTTNDVSNADENIEDLPAENYTQEFHDTIAKMKECYTLMDYKGVDLDQLEKEYEHLFIAADASGDQVDAFFAWNAFCNAIPDGHVYVCGKNTEEHNKLRAEMLDRYMGYDYGFVCMRNEDQKIVFVSVDDTSEAYEIGIRQGMVLTSVDGIDVEEAIGNESMLAKYSDNTNRRMMLPIYLTCQYGDKLTITYVDFEENEHTVDLIGSGRYYNRFKKINSLLHPNREWDKEYEAKMLEGEIGYLAIHTVLIKSSNGFNNAGSYDELRDDLTSEINRLKNDGAKKLIIDLRDNGGGYGEVSMTIASLFSDEEIFCARLDGPEETMRQVSGAVEQKIMPCNVWGDGDILVLVNDNTASGAELLAYALRKLPNVKTIGMTNSCGCAMGTFGLELKNFSMSYPLLNYIDENDEIIIDADSTGDMKMPVDIRIPLDDTAIKRIFTDGEDYCLEYSIEKIK